MHRGFSLVEGREELRLLLCCGKARTSWWLTLVREMVLVWESTWL